MASPFVDGEILVRALRTVKANVRNLRIIFWRVCGKSGLGRKCLDFADNMSWSELQGPFLAVQ